MPKIVTNGTYLHNQNAPEKTTLRRFVVIAEHEGWAWVKPINGLHQKEGPLTFQKQHLKEVNQ